MRQPMLWSVLIGLVLAVPVVRAQDAEVSREHSMLRGFWNLETMVDDGESLNALFIAEKIARDRRVAIGNRLIKITNPMTGEVRTWSFRLEPRKTPRVIEIVNDHDDTIPGIYRFDGDKLIMCLANGGQGSLLPTEFKAETGSGHVLLTMAMIPADVIKEEERKAAEAEAAKAKAAAEEAKAAEEARLQEAEAKVAASEDRKLFVAVSSTTAASPEELARAKDVELARMMLGKWTFVDTNGQVTIAFEPNGKFRAARNWDKALKRMFQGTTYSNGSWTVASATVTVRVDGSTSRKSVDDVFVGRIRSISDNTLSFTDVLGRVNTARRVQ